MPPIAKPFPDASSNAGSRLLGPGQEDGPLVREHEDPVHALGAGDGALTASHPIMIACLRYYRFAIRLGIFAFVSCLNKKSKLGG